MSEAKGEAIGLAYAVPQDQRLSYTVTPGPGALMSAESIGGQLVALAKLLESQTKKDSPKIKWGVFLLGIYTNADGSLKFDLMIAPQNTPAAITELGGNNS